jgi:hypothetical protein
MAVKHGVLSLGLLLVAAQVVAAEALPDGYYATKADYRAGIVTLGPLPQPDFAPSLDAGGDTCATPPTIFSTTPFNDTSTTIGANNTVTTLPIACNSNYTQVAGPDVIYRFTMGPTHTAVGITVTPTGWDASIYLLTACPAGTGNTGACPSGAGSDAGGTGIAETISATATNALPAGTYFLFVDSFFASGPDAAGPYSLAVSGTLPVELIDFSLE